MSVLESMVLSYLTNALWQVPLLFGAGWLTARAFRALGPAAEHRVWVSVLLLQTLLPMASMIPADMLRSLIDFSGGSMNNGQPHVSVVMGAGTVVGDPHFPAWLLAALAVVYVVTIGWFAARFAWRVRTIQRLHQRARGITLSGGAARYWARCERTFGVERASAGTCSQLYGPITIGIRRKLVLLPSEMLAALPESELRTAIAHEFAHMRRHDFLKNLLYEFVCLPVRFHPVLWLTRERLTETREMVCDQMAAALAERREYARSLLRLASLLVDGMPARTPHTIGIFDSTTFERRVMRLTEKAPHTSALRRLTTATACLLLGTGICATTVALSVHVDALAAARDEQPASKSGTISVKSGIMQNQIVHKVTPTYPPEAKKAHIQGKVVLEAIISKTGEVENLKVVSGPKELQQSSLDAVRQWLYKPYLMNGQPVEVKTTVNVTYTLAK